MEDIIDQLREVNQGAVVPLPLPTLDDIIEVQEQILIHIPADYREFLLTVSDVIYGRLEPATVADSGLHTYLPEVAAQAWSEGVPRHLIPICEDQGQYYCITESGEISLWAGAQPLGEEWENIWYWVRDVWLEGN
ncbi:SMI1/KNR4 family protein [Marinibactrum halimedae]|uniref:Knr4/Smi1-like domain-containing protein n=1 Tax=Marinibactrum halimedae TaxID=1444977 RepID=A0AA37T890_9GAMM|nr:SMI1/KNR4 family protein [Marinibactrum halimedae]MCD9459408.1 SMI1/KNR4 family protein [Marinibactrum halimedae]GLS27526.1 hypothetical protein GCM10007877_32450 [Marinibactrum halimedae]